MKNRTQQVDSRFLGIIFAFMGLLRMSEGCHRCWHRRTLPWRQTKASLISISLQPMIFRYRKMGGCEQTMISPARSTTMKRGCGCLEIWPQITSMNTAKNTIQTENAIL
jgi:hypothetical protein